MLVAYAYCEVEEGRRNFEDCYKTYESLIEKYHQGLDKLIAKRDQEIAAATEQAKILQGQKPEQEVDSKDTVMNGGEENEKTLGEEMIQIRDTLTNRANPPIEAMKRAAASVWITQMRFARRAEVRIASPSSGLDSSKFSVQGIKQARAVFARVRKSSHLTWQVFEANGAHTTNCSNSKPS